MIAVLQSSSALGVLPLASSVYASATAPNWTPKFLSALQNETLIALGERIIPGSSEALCNRLIDLVLPLEGEKNKGILLQSLAAFDQEADRFHQQHFSQLNPAQQDEILTIASQGGKLYNEFGVVKEWMADAYWSSLKGLKELGWTGRMAWESFPDCGQKQPAQ